MASIHWHSVFFYLFATLACGCAAAVALSRHIVRMAFYLVLSLASGAGLFFLAGADFVGAAQLLIYVGATLVLLIFGVMLTAEGRFVTMRTRGGDWMLGLLAGGALLVIFSQASLGVARWNSARAERHPAVSQPTAARLGLGLLGVRVDRLEAPAAAEPVAAAGGGATPALEATAETGGAAARRGAGSSGVPRDTRGLAGYLLPFEIISVHLLVALIGAAYLARPKRRAGPPAQREAPR